jgi:hypothetical protein
VDGNPDNKARLAEAVRRQGRRNARMGFAARLAGGGSPGSIVGDERQLNLIACLKELRRGPPRSFDDIFSAIAAIQSVVGDGRRVVLHPCVEEWPGAMVSAADFFAAVQRDPFLLSLDGFVVMSPEGDAAAELDYLDEGPDSPAELRTYGLWATAPEAQTQ